VNKPHNRQNLLQIKVILWKNHVNYLLSLCKSMLNRQYLRFAGQTLLSRIRARILDE